MELEDLGFDGKIRELIDLSDWNELEIGRVIIEYKERYSVQTISGKFNAEILGNLRYTAKSRDAFPAVGDWVKINPIDKDFAVIVEVLPRISILERKAVATVAEKQIIATNIDVAMIIQSFGQDFNLNRIDRYITICHNAKIKPIILLTKSDLVDNEEIDDTIQKVSQRAKGIEVIAISTFAKYGFDELYQVMEAHKSYCFLGSSGVGKSTIINFLMGEDILETSEISQSTNKGRHTTSHRELIILPNKSIVIDTPGMRELGITDDTSGVDLTFEEIAELSQNCRFKDCTHTNESGCAILRAIKDGELESDVLLSYQKLIREQNHFSSSIVEKRRKGKAQGKLYKAILEEKRKNKF